MPAAPVLKERNVTPHTQLPLQAVLFDMDGTLVDTERLDRKSVV